MARIISLVAAVVAMLAANLSPAQSKVTVSISCSSLGVELELCQQGANDWATETGNA